ncbi:MAG: hypothetical protein AVDCRST_MAG87-2396 [uncultured Thermomicrobiales bacterium]|uniref:SHSP domain-containing protein n=1 Tax=uncultured Thermomicrobiales bacterium TaxID=1645740 RepID=A0A6J4V9A4_9BACT|nr:MAG: hypothetical protein AVDCRST_MAG87-2396 [uncultured Thermomicrobiales bacterium]
MIVVRRGRPRELVRRSSEIDELYRAMMSSRSHTEWRPPLDVYQTAGTIEIVAEIAGLDRQQIEVMIEGDTISIRGQRADPAACEQRSFHQARIVYGAFALDVHVPVAVEGERATASYENGFLRISIPRNQPRTIRSTSVPVEPGQHVDGSHDRRNT